jgi:hypothetical protein
MSGPGRSGLGGYRAGRGHWWSGVPVTCGQKRMASAPEPLKRSMKSNEGAANPRLTA